MSEDHPGHIITTSTSCFALVSLPITIVTRKPMLTVPHPYFCYNLITQVATLGLRLKDELGVRGREYTID